MASIRKVIVFGYESHFFRNHFANGLTSFDVTEVYTTDGLNRKAKLKVLKDDLGFFPDYNGAFLVRDGTFEKFSRSAPNLEEVLSLLENQISNEDMVEMTYHVDVLGEPVDSVATDFLQRRRLITSE